MGRAYNVTFGVWDVAVDWAARDAYQWVDSPSLVKPSVGSTPNVGAIVSAAGPELGTVGRTIQAGTTTVSGSSDQYWENIDFIGRVTIASGTTGTKRFRNCRFFGETSPTSSAGLIHATANHTANVVLEDCTLAPTSITYWRSGALGHHITLRRCLVKHVTDGVGLYNTSAPGAALSATVELCWIGPLVWHYPVADQSDGSHTDTIQIQGGTGAVMRGCVLYGYHDTSVSDSPYTRRDGVIASAPNGVDSGHSPGPRCTNGLMLNANVGATGGHTFRRNWVYGGEFGVNAGNDALTGDMGTYADNRFLDQYFGSDAAMSRDASVTWTTSGNVYDDTGDPITIATNG